MSQLLKELLEIIKNGTGVDLIQFIEEHPEVQKKLEEKLNDPNYR